MSETYENHYEHIIKEKDMIIDNLNKRIKELEGDLYKSRKKCEDLEDQLSQNINSPSDGSVKQNQSRYWTPEEHQRFLEAIQRFGDKDVKAIAAYVGSRNATQVRTHGQKYYLKLERERKRKEDDSKLTSPVIQHGTSTDKISETTNGKKTKAASNNKRRKSVSDIPSTPSMPAKIEQFSPRSTPIQPIMNNPAIPHFIQQQIAAETRDSVLAQMKNWGTSDYYNFIEGLVAYSEEKDIHRRCQLISEHYLNKFSADEIKHCFTVLSNVAKHKEKDDRQDEFGMDRPKPEGGGYMTYTPEMRFIQFQRPMQYPVDYPINQTNFSMNHILYSNPDAFQRRASFPLDPFSRANKSEEEHFDFPPEIPTWLPHGFEMDIQASFDQNH